MKLWKLFHNTRKWHGDLPVLPYLKNKYSDIRRFLEGSKSLLDFSREVFCKFELFAS